MIETKDMKIDIEQIKKDANTPKPFLNLLVYLTPVKKGKTYRFKEDVRPHVYKTPSRVWVLEDMSKQKGFFKNTRKTKLPTGDIWEATKSNFNFSKYNKGEVMIAKTVCRLAGLTFEDYIIQGK